MYYLVIFVCAATSTGCFGVNVPGPGFANVQQCRDVGTVNATEYLQSKPGAGGLTVEGFICLKR